MNIETNISLADKNWFKTGGCAAFFAQPTTSDEARLAVLFAQERSLSITVLGQGANILISDDGIDGLVISPALKSITVDSGLGLVTAGAGVGVQELIDYCLGQGFFGLEDFSGIPGSVGGSVYINIHYFQYLLSDFLIKATVIDKRSGELLSVDRDWFAFGYNQSTLQAGNHMLLDATFKVAVGDPLAIAYARGRRDEIVRHRNRRYPTSNTCGSFFRAFFDHEVPEINGKKIPYVGYYLDKVGVKGVLRVGNAVVSHQHANMLVTLPGATSSDVIQLARSMQQKVYDVFGVMPQAECQFLGFKENPLLTR